MNDRLAVYNPRSKLVNSILSLLIALGALGFGAYKFFEAGNILVGIGITIVCLSCVSALIKDGVEYFSEIKPRIIIDRNGVEVTRWTCGLIPWEEISTIRAKRTRIDYIPIRQLILKIKDPYKYSGETSDNVIQRIIGKIEASLTGGDNQLSLNIDAGYSVGFDEVWRHIQMLKEIYHIPTSIRGDG
jgi:hypothetical protein